MSSRLARAGAVGAMAVGAVVVVSSFGAPGGAQTDATTPIAHPGFDDSPAVSHDGRTIVFVSTPEGPGEASSIVVHQRAASSADGATEPATTTPITDSAGGRNPSISGDGCVITWSVPATGAPAEPEPGPSDPADEPLTSDPAPDDADETNSSDPASTSTSEPSGSDSPDSELATSADSEAATLQAAPARLVALDRCADPEANPAGVRVDLALREDDLSFGPAATSLDGSLIAVSNGTDVIVFRRAEDGGYAEESRFDGRDSETTDHLVAERVDVSDDGSVIVFSGGTDLADTALMTVFAHVVDDGDGVTSPVLPAATAPTVSGDGDLVVASTGADGSSVALVDRTAVPLAPVDLGPGRRPAISADGNHVVFEEGANLAVVSRIGQSDDSFATTQRTLLSSTFTPTRSGPAIDRLGTTVVSDRDVGEATQAENSDISVTVLGADASFDAAMFDLGSGDVGAVLSSTVTFSNRGPASVGVAEIGVDGTFVIDDNRCAALLRPGTTCEIDVTFTVERLEDAFGTVTLTPTSVDVEPYTTQVTALGVAPIPSTSATTTSTPNSSTGGTTGSTSSTGRTTSGGSSTGRTSTGRTSTSGSTGGTTRTTTTTTTVAPGAGVSASPATFDFAPTIIDAGRRTGLVEIVNNGTGAVSIVGVRLDPTESGAFQIVETECAGESVAAGSRCGVTLAFAPTETGSQSVSLIASIEGGTEVTVAVTGVGAPTPTVDVIPGVATVGQVVTLSGAGFPTGITVEVTWAATELEVVVSDSGTFNLPVVVMSHTPTGPATVVVAGQADMFPTVAGTMVVTDTSDRSTPSVLDGLGPNIGR